MTMPRLNRPADDVIQEEQRRALRPGGALGVVGGLGYFALLLVHGDLPDQTTAAALEHIAGRPEWRTLKLTLIACVLCWIGAFAALAGSFSTGLGRWLGQWAVAVSAVGATIVIVEYAIIGHALKDIADAWHAAPEAEAATHLQLADVMLTITGGLFHSFVAADDQSGIAHGSARHRLDRPPRVPSGSGTSVRHSTAVRSPAPVWENPATRVRPAPAGFGAENRASR